jgi:hypothetical protein
MWKSCQDITGVKRKIKKKEEKNCTFIQFLV